MQSKLTKRQQRVIQIIQKVVPRVMLLGTWDRMGCSTAPAGEIPYFGYEGDGFNVSLRTPFQKHDESDDVLKLLAALRKLGANVPCPTLPWGLDIWPAEGTGVRGKVLNVSWDDHGKLLITSFRRGPWEDQILQWKTPNAVPNTPVNVPAGRPDLRLVAAL